MLHGYLCGYLNKAMEKILFQKFKPDFCEFARNKDINIVFCDFPLLITHVSLIGSILNKNLIKGYYHSHKPNLLFITSIE